MVKQLVELHGGTVQVISGGLGHGSEFLVRIPVAD
jgi:signal transduction histidine kinase